MPGEDKQDVEAPELDEVKPDPKTGKFPENIPSTKYIAVKEAWGKAKEKAANLEAKLKDAPTKEAYDKLVKERDEAIAKAKEITDKAKASEEKTATELRESLKGKGLTDEELKSMSVAEMQTVSKVLGSKQTSLPDLTGGGGSSGELKGSPMELAVRGYNSSNKPKK